MGFVRIGTGRDAADISFTPIWLKMRRLKNLAHPKFDARCLSDVQGTPWPTGVGALTTDVRAAEIGQRRTLRLQAAYIKKHVGFLLIPWENALGSPQTDQA
jgi:hypothetical protein